MIQVITGSSTKRRWAARRSGNAGFTATAAAQAAPRHSSGRSDLNQIMARIFEGLVQDKEAVINAVMKVIEAVPNDRDFRRESVRVEEELQSLEQKKDRLLDLSISGAIGTAEFKKRNDGFNDQMQRLELQLAEIRQEEETEQSHGSTDAGDPDSAGTESCPLKTAWTQHLSQRS